MKKIEITKDNYEKYVDLYHLKNFFGFIDNEGKKMDLYTAICAIIFGTLYILSLLNNPFSMLVSVSLFFLTLLGSTGIPLINFVIGRKRKLKEFKKNNPDIETDISFSELKEVLKNKGLLTIFGIDINNYLVQLDIEEKKLEEQKILNEYENIKEKTFNNNYFIDSPTFTMEDQEKSKVKVKQYLKK